MWIKILYQHIRSFVRSFVRPSVRSADFNISIFMYIQFELFEKKKEEIKQMRSCNTHCYTVMNSREERTSTKKRNGIHCNYLMTTVSVQQSALKQFFDVRKRAKSNQSSILERFSPSCILWRMIMMMSSRLKSYPVVRTIFAPVENVLLADEFDGVRKKIMLIIKRKNLKVAKCVRVSYRIRLL